MRWNLSKNWMFQVEAQKPSIKSPKSRKFHIAYACQVFCRDNTEKLSWSKVWKVSEWAMVKASPDSKADENEDSGLFLVAISLFNNKLRNKPYKVYSQGHGCKWVIKARFILSFVSQNGNQWKWPVKSQRMRNLWSERNPEHHQVGRLPYPHPPSAIKLCKITI